MSVRPPGPPAWYYGIRVQGPEQSTSAPTIQPSPWVRLPGSGSSSRLHPDLPTRAESVRPGTPGLHKFRLLHSMRFAKRSLSAQYTRRKVYRYVENRLFCKEKPGCCLLCMQTSVCMAEYLTTAGLRDISTKHQYQQSNSCQDSPILSIRFEVLNWQVSAWGTGNLFAKMSSCSAGILAAY